MKWPSVRDVSRKTVSSVLRFPLSYVAALFCFSVTAINIYSSNFFDHELAMRFLTTGTLGISLFLAARFIAETRFQNVNIASAALMLAATLILVLFYLSYKMGTRVYYYRYWQLMLAFHLLVALSVTMPVAFWRFNAHMFSRISASALYSWTLYLGLCFALWAIKTLLGVPVDSKTYRYLGAFIGFIYNTWFFLIGFPEKLADYEEPTTYPSGLRVFAQYILMPLIVIYLAIFYLYVGKICIHRTWPVGMIGYMVCCVALVGILTHLLLDPLQDDDRYPAVKMYTRWFYRLLLPLSVVLVVATWRRVDQYGLTEKRYVLFLIAGWTAWLSVYFGWLKKRNLQVIPFTLFVLAIVTIGGPWGAYSMSKRNQLGRLVRTLEKIGALKDGHVQLPVNPVSQEDRLAISRTLDYLFTMHGKKSVEPIFGPGSDFAQGLMSEKLGLVYISSGRDYSGGNAGASEQFYANMKEGGVANIDGYAAMFNFNFWGPSFSKQEKKMEFDGQKYELSFTNERNALWINSSGRLLIEISFDDILSKVGKCQEKNAKSTYAQCAADELSTSSENADVRTKVQLTNITTRVSGSSTTIQSLAGYLLFKAKKPAH